MYRLVKVSEAHRAKAGGSAIEVVKFKTPYGTRLVKWWATHLGDAPLRHDATPQLNANTSSGNFLESFGTGHPDSYFRLTGPGPKHSIDEKSYTEASDTFAWIIQANGINPNQFFIRVKFYVWTPNEEENKNAHP